MTSLTLVAKGTAQKSHPRYQPKGSSKHHPKDVNSLFYEHLKDVAKFKQVNLHKHKILLPELTPP